MNATKLKYWRGALNILIAVATPFGLYASGETSLLGAGVGAVIGGLTATLNWIDTSLQDQTGVAPPPMPVITSVIGVGAPGLPVGVPAGGAVLDPTAPPPELVPHCEAANADPRGAR